MARKLRSAVEIVSDIGSLGFDLQHHDETQIAGAVAMLRTVNPEMFDWLVRVLATPADGAARVLGPRVAQPVEQKERTKTEDDQARR